MIVTFQIEVVNNESDSPMDAFKGALRLFCTRDMLLLSVTFIYTGKDDKWLLTIPSTVFY